MLALKKSEKIPRREAVRLAEEQSDLERLRAVEANIAKLSVEVMEHTDVGGKLV